MKKLCMLILSLMLTWVLCTFDGNEYRAHKIVQRGWYVFGHDMNNRVLWQIPYHNVASIEWER